MKHRKLSGDIQTGASVLSRDKGVEGYLFTVHAVSGVQEAECVNDFETADVSI
jgi:hypothetical protein